MVAVLPQG